MLASGRTERESQHSVGSRLKKVTWVLWPFAITMHTHTTSYIAPKTILLGKLLKAPFSCSPFAFFFSYFDRSSDEIGFDATLVKDIDWGFVTYFVENCYGIAMEQLYIWLTILLFF